jgi:hypothetical protein
MCAFSARKQHLRSLQKARQIEASEFVWSQWAIEHLAEQSAAPDCLQRPLLRRSRFRQQVSLGVRCSD